MIHRLLLLLVFVCVCVCGGGGLVLVLQLCSSCHVAVRDICLFLMVPWIGLWSLLVAFPSYFDHWMASVY